MSSHTNKLDELRQQIDRIDDRIHDLLMERSGMIEQIVAAKRDGQAKLRPGREAEIARRLVARHGGHFPPASLVRIWREIINAFTCMQGPFSIAVPEPPADRGLWELARDHFGGTPARLATQSAAEALRAVIDGKVTLAVLPWGGRTGAWPRDLLAVGEHGLGICFGLPFVRSTDGEETQAVAVGRVTPEATGSDRAVLAIETTPRDDQAAIDAALTEAGLQPLRSWRVEAAVDGAPGGGGLWMSEVSGDMGDVGDHQGRLDRTLGEGRRATVLGGYAEPIVLSEPKERPGR